MDKEYQDNQVLDSLVEEYSQEEVEEFKEMVDSRGFALLKGEMLVRLEEAQRQCVDDGEWANVRKAQGRYDGIRSLWNWIIDVCNLYGEEKDE